VPVAGLLPSRVERLDRRSLQVEKVIDRAFRPMLRTEREIVYTKSRWRVSQRGPAFPKSCGLAWRRFRKRLRAYTLQLYGCHAQALRTGGGVIPTIHDVAARADVSIATVSRALRGLPHVAMATRQRVEAAAKDLNYVVSPAASGLASGRTKSIGLVAPFISRWFFAEVADGIEEVLRADDTEVLMYNVHTSARRARFFDSLPIRRRVDGLIILSLPLNSDELALLRPLDVPTVLVGLRAEGFSSVRIDDTEGAARATHHLINLGHERIALLSDCRFETIPFKNSAERRQGYRGALLSSGLTPDPSLDVSGPFGVNGGAQAMAQLLAAPTPPTAVFAEFDEMAYGALRTMRRMRLAVPDDISVIGFDDHELADMMDLTTVRQPVREQGVRAAQLLLEMLDRPHRAPVDVVLPTELIVRGTTAAPRLPRSVRSLG
jgi:LacI family transcriptional regulator, repressor for deo operon, udp, cdd, tsx, nupC, and nupG